MSRIIKLSPSKIEKFQRCSWMYYLEELCGFMSIAELQNQIGLACHEFVAGLHKPKARLYEVPVDPTPRFTKENVRAEWHPFWTKYIARIKKVLVPRSVLEELYRVGLQIGPEYIKLYLAHPKALNIDSSNVEIPFEGIHVPGTSVDLNLRVDQIRPLARSPGGDVLVDLKFSDRNDFDPAENFALKCYALAYREVYGKKESAVSIWNVPFGPAVGIKVSKLSDQDLEKTTNEIRKVGLNIINNKFSLAKDEVTCATCSTKELCRSPGRSSYLQKLAQDNTGYKGPLPTCRSDIIAERMLELPDGKPIRFQDEQASLEI